MKYDVSQTLHAISHVVDFQWCTQLVECLNNKLRDVDIIIHWSIDVYWFEAPSLIYSKAFYRPNVCLKTNLTEAKYSPIPIPSYTPVVSSCRSHCFFLAMPQIERFPQPDKSRLDWPGPSLEITWAHISLITITYIWWIIDQWYDLMSYLFLTVIVIILVKNVYLTLLAFCFTTNCIFCFHLLPPPGEWEFWCSTPKHCGCGTGTAGTDARMQRTQTVYRERATGG